MKNESRYARSEKVEAILKELKDFDFELYCIGGRLQENHLSGTELNNKLNNVSDDLIESLAEFQYYLPRLKERLWKLKDESKQVVSDQNKKEKELCSMENIKLPHSVLTKKQVKVFTKSNGKETIKVVLRFDDDCNNKHNSFGITGDYYNAKTGEDVAGCIHDKIVKWFPEYGRFIKWHLTSTDCPMHYLANTLHWFKEGNLENACASAVLPIGVIEHGYFDCTKEELIAKLKDRLPALMEEFKQDMESLGFIY